MQLKRRKWIIIGGVVLVLVITLIVIFSSAKKVKEPIPSEVVPVVKTTTGPVIKTIGLSVQGRKIESYTYGSGATHLAFVGGVHGGYEWNTVLLAYKFIDYLNANPSVIPAYLTVTVIPDANPDGMYKVVGKEGRFLATDIPKDTALLASGRFNANAVDINRNFDCEWQPKSMWQGKEVSAGTAVFSEPEAKTLQNFFLTEKPVAGIFWHSQSGNVYGSDCENGTLPETLKIMNTYAKAAGYGAVEKFDAYKVTGDSEGWLAKIGIPAITVELKTHDSVEWEQNLSGVKAIFSYYTPKK